MPGHLVFSENSDGSDRVCLSQLRPIRGLKFSWGLPGGPLAASWSFFAPPDYQHRALNPNRTITIINGGGGRAFRGRLNVPTRANPWLCEADGMGALALRYRAYPIPTSGNYYDLNNVLNQAVNVRGLPWVIPTGLPVGAGTPGGQVPDLTIADVLNQVTAQSGQTWWVTPNDRLTIGSPLATPNYVFCPSDPGGGRGLNENYVSGMLTFYKDVNGANAIYFVAGADGRTDKWGSAEQSFDATGYGNLTSAQVQAITAAEIAIHPARVPYKGQFTLSHGQVRTAPGGSAVDLSSLRPPITGQLVVTDPDHAAELDTTKPTWVWVQLTEYDDDTDSLSVTPWDSSGDDFKAMLTGATKSWVRQRSGVNT